MSTSLIVAIVLVLLLGAAALALLTLVILVAAAVAGSIAGTLASIAGFLLLSQISYQRWARRTGAPRLSGSVLRLQLGEAWAVVRLGIWHLTGQILAPFRTPPRGTPVIAVHGYTQNGTSFEALRRALARRGRPVRTVFLGFAWPWRRVGDYGAPLVAALERAPDRVDLIAHSMGGLVIRDVLNRFPHLRDRVRAVCTLGSPHGGTAAARRFTWLHPASDLMQGSGWIRTLPTLGDLLPHARLTTIGSSGDLIVYPVETTRQPGAERVEFDDIGHVGLLTDKRALDAAVMAVC